MSARYSEVRARLRTLFADHTRLEQLRHMTGTGVGITRIPAVATEQAPEHIVRSGGYSPRIGRHFQASDLVRHRYEAIIIKSGPAYTEFFASPSPETEIDMRHYWALCHEKQALESKLHNYVTGHTWFIPHVSPFGSDRFRAFDPLPAFDSAGHIRAI